MKKVPVNIPASILSRLLKHSREQKTDYQSLLNKYVAERFLYRLGQTEYKQSFILKGAYILTIMLENQTYRTTKDIDFLKTGNTEKEEIKNAIAAICNTDCPEDGVTFDADSIQIDDIRELNLYNGHRVKLTSFIGNVRNILQIDIGIGDSIYPEAKRQRIESILDLPDTEITAYPIETIIAEKLEAIVSKSILTSRMKDFYDLYIIISGFELDYFTVHSAVLKTFERRGSAIPEILPIALSDEFYKDPLKQKQWNAFVKKLRNEYSNLSLQTVINELEIFTEALWKKNSSLKKWIPKKGWAVII